MSETTLVNLSILSQLALGERLRVRGQGRFWQLYAARDEHAFRFRIPEMLLRWWDGSSRHSDFTAILDMYAEATQSLKRLKLDTSPSARATERALVQRLRASVDGLRMLERTYAGDLTLVSRIQRLVERVHLLCADYPDPQQAQAASKSTDLEPAPCATSSLPSQNFALDVNAPEFNA